MSASGNDTTTPVMIIRLSLNVKVDHVLSLQQLATCVKASPVWSLYASYKSEMLNTPIVKGT